MAKTNLNNFGKKLKFNKRTPKKRSVSEKDMFIQSVDAFYKVWKRSNTTYELYKINLLEYEEDFYQIIESFIFMKYGEWKTELIMWYVFAREDEKGNVLPLTLQVENKGEAEVYIKTADDLWEFIKKLEEEEENNKNQ